MENRIKTYFENRPEVAAVYLFGSYGSNKFRAGSDVDLGILLNPAESDTTSHISEALCEKMVRAVGFRNLVAHEYGRLDLDRAFEVARTDIKDLDTFIETIIQSL